MTAGPVSVIIASRHRPAALIRCLTALFQSDHRCFEVIAVADPASLAALAHSRFHGLIKTAGLDMPNIAVARNIGIGLAAAPVVAFIDDDAVPEPTWLSRLTAPFADAGVAAAGGFVRGRNGLSYQWTARSIDRNTVETDLDVDWKAPTLHSARPGHAIKTEGTNCAFRTAQLARIGGFDPNFAFYLDEADVNMRLAAAGATTAIVPGAEVHHAFAASARRTAGRVPLSLHDVGASTAVFLRRHDGDPDPALAWLRDGQRHRLLRLMVDGRITPGDVGRLLRTLETGFEDGFQRPLSPLPALHLGDAGFLPLPETGPRQHDVIPGRSWQARALKAAAKASVAQGRITTVIRLSPTVRPHRVRFVSGGYWEQVGGTFGPLQRGRQKFWLGSFSQRIIHEIARISATRPLAKPATGIKAVSQPLPACV